VARRSGSATNFERGFSESFEWATWYADSIDPIVQAQRPDEQPQGPTRTPASELDLTAHARSIASKLHVKDSDALASTTGEQIRQACGYSDQQIWDEFIRVLEALGYDVAKRDYGYPWY